MKDVMIDAEWLGERVASVALVMFDRKTGETGAEFYARIKWKGKHDQAGSLDPETVYWWFTQCQSARDELTDPQDRKPIGQVGGDVARFIKVLEPTEFWQRGDMDRATLEAALYPSRGSAPWDFWQWNDVRTLTKLHPDDLKAIHPGDHHALNDAHAQIKQLMEALTWLGQA